MPTTPPSAFVPTPAQRKLLDYMDASPCLKTIGELCAGAGVPRRSYYNWSRDPAFRAWFAQAWSARLIMDNAVLFNQARLLASRHFSYWRALFNLTMDPKGLALLQQWQENCAALASDAFINADPDPAESAPAPVPAPPQPNQPLPPNSGTNSHPAIPVRQRLGTHILRAAATPQINPRLAEGPELPQRHGAGSQGQDREIRNGGNLRGSDSWEGARSKPREAAAGDGEGAYTEVRDRAGFKQSAEPGRGAPGEALLAVQGKRDGRQSRPGARAKNEAQRRLSPRPAPPCPTPVQHTRALRQALNHHRRNRTRDLLRST